MPTGLDQLQGNRRWHTVQCGISENHLTFKWSVSCSIIGIGAESFLVSYWRKIRMPEIRSWGETEFKERHETGLAGKRGPSKFNRIGYISVFLVLALFGLPILLFAETASFWGPNHLGDTNLSGVVPNISLGRRLSAILLLVRMSLALAGLGPLWMRRWWPVGWPEGTKPALAREGLHSSLKLSRSLWPTGLIKGCAPEIRATPFLSHRLDSQTSSTSSTSRKHNRANI
jgi:hypothetical protein